jgi:hypothetical protein
MTTLKELAAMLDAATGPCWELDADLAVVFDGMTFGVGMWGSMLVGPNGNFFPVPDYTSSMDAVLALVERLLPGCWHRQTHNYPPGNHTCQIRVIGLCWFDAHNAPTPALAILKALVAALIAQENSDLAAAIRAEKVADHDPAVTYLTSKEH